MSSRPANTTSPSETRSRSFLTPHTDALLLMWLVVTGAVVVMLLQDVRSADRYSVVRYVLQAGYVAALLWYLARSGPSVGQLPEFLPQVLPRWRLGAWVPVVGLALLLAMTAVSHDGLDMLMLLLIAATASILLAWRREIRLRATVQGLAVALIAYLAGLPAANNGLLGEPRTLCSPPCRHPCTWLVGCCSTAPGWAGFNCWREGTAQS